MKDVINAIKNIGMRGQHNIVKIFCLTLGLGVSFVLVSEIWFSNNWDNFIPEQDRTYAVLEKFLMNGEEHVWSSTSGAIAHGMKKYCSQIEAATRMTSCSEGSTISTEDKLEYSANVVYADSCWFDVIPRDILSGDPHEILSVPMECMICSTLAEKMGEDPVGKRIVITEYPGEMIVIRGIFEAYPKNSSFSGVDVVLSLPSIGKFSYDGRDNWLGNDRYSSYIRLAEGASPDDLIPSTEKMLEENVDIDELRKSGMEYSFSFLPMTDYHFDDDNVKHTFWIMILLSVVIVLVTVLNYLLIVMSGMVSRSKEMAVRKCYGADRCRIFSIVFSEALVHVFIAVILASMVLYAVQGSIRNFVSAPLGDLMRGGGLWICAGICLLALLFGGVLPSALYNRVPVSSAFRGYMERRRSWKLALLSVQFAAAAFLFSLLAVVSLQYRRMVNAELGYSYDNLAVFCLEGGWNDMADANTLLKGELSKMPEVEGISSQMFLMTGYQSGDNVSPAGDDKIMLNCSDFYYVSDDWLKILDIPLLSGENFVEGADTLMPQVLVSESLEKKMSELAGWTDGIVGKRLDITGHEMSTFTVRGVFPDLKVGPATSPDDRPQMVFYYKRPFRNLLIRLHNLDAESMRALQSKIEELLPGKDFSLRSYATELADNYQQQKTFRSALVICSLVILLIALAGLIGYSSDEVTRRRKEIAIRKVNGALTGDIFSMFIKDISKVAVPSAVVGAVVAWVVSAQWIQLFSERIYLNPLIFLCACVLVLAIVYAVVTACSSVIARSNPANFIKDE